MKRSPVLLTLLPFVLLLPACGSSAKDDDTVDVVASFYPLAWVAERVGGSFVDVTNLTTPGSEPHDLELAPRQVGAVQDAELVVYQRHLQAAVDEAVEQAGRTSDGTVDLADELILEPASDHDHEEGHDHGDSEEDPHTWLDPNNMVVVAKAVADHLAKADPDHAADYRKNADTLITELTELDEAYTTGLKTCRTRTIVTSHSAFHYLAGRYDLVQVPIAGIEPSSEPSPAQLADITELVKREKITTIFTEELVRPTIARTIADETGARTATLDPIEGLSDRTKDEDYLSIMRSNLDTLKKANSCS